MTLYNKLISTMDSKSVALMRFIAVKAPCHESFTTAFDVSQDSIPMIVAYAPFKNRYAKFLGSVSDVSTFMLCVHDI